MALFARIADVSDVCPLVSRVHCPSIRGVPNVPGGETGAGGRSAWVVGSAPGRSLGLLYGSQFFGNMMFGQSDWSYEGFEMDRDVEKADALLANTMNAADSDLRPFRRRGGKLILYHGWSDPAVSPLNTVDYINAVEAKLGRMETEGFVRLFLVPGMQHCGGGASPNDFGQNTASETDSQRSIIAALERWIEKGVAPASIVASEVKPGISQPSAIVRTRPLCAYPKVSKWNGSGSVNDASSFSCVDSTK